MNFRQRNNNFSTKNNANKKKYLQIIIVIILILFFSVSFTRNILFSVGAPIWAIKNNVISFFKGNINIFTSKLSLINENILLKEQMKLQEKNSALYDILKKENEDLKNVLNRSKMSQKLILGSVLVKPFLSAYDTLIVDIGKSNGVAVGDKVLADGDVYIGYVSEVYDKTSKVVLYSAPGEKVQILIGNNNIEKEAVGLGGGNFSVEMPREIDIKEGDSIVIPSISPNIFGVVEKVVFKESDSFQNILFKSPVNISELKWVEIIISAKK